jgi:hypothetical protein
MQYRSTLVRKTEGKNSLEDLGVNGVNIEIGLNWV